MLKLLPRSPKNTQPNLFHNQLLDMLDSNDPLVAHEFLKRKMGLIVNYSY